MFSRLADVVVRRYKLIIVVWIVALFYVFPLVFKVNSVVVYNENEVGLNKLEAVEAGNLIASQFPGHVPTSSITIVIQNSNVSSPEARTFASALYENITQEGALQGVSRVDYLYSALQSYVQGVVGQAAPTVHLLAAQTNSTASLVFGVPLEVVQKHLALLAQSYSDSAAMSITVQNITQELILAGENSTMVSFTVGYIEEFYATWTRSADLTLINDQIVLAADQFFPMTGEIGRFALAVAHGLNATDFSSAFAQKNFAIGVVSAQIQSTFSFGEGIWDLGPSPSAATISAFAESVVFGYPLGELPIAVPQALVSQFVNIHSATGQSNSTMLMAVSLTVESSSKQASDDVKSLRTMVHALASSNPGYVAYISGDPAINVDTQDAVAKDTGKIDPATIILVLLFVGLFFRSTVSPWIPLVTVGLAYLLTMAVIYILGLYVMHIHYSVLTFVLVVMLGAGSDYCIFIMSRFREERVAGKTKEEAVKTSLTWAGESIATSGATVMIGFGALMIGQYSLVKSMGMALVAAVGMVLLFALTMLPSLLMLVGDRIFWPNTIKKESKRIAARDARGGGYFRKSARFSLKHSKVIVIAALIVVVPAVYGVLSLHSSYDFISSLPKAESKLGIDALAEGFGKGTIMPTYVVLTFDRQVVTKGTLNATAAAQIEAYCTHVSTMENIRTISGPTRPFGTPVNSTYLDSLPADQRAAYFVAIKDAFGADNRTILMTVVLQDEPFTTHSIHSIDQLRTYDGQAVTQVFGGQAQLLVGGSTASTADVSRTVANDFFTMRFLVMAGIYVVLMFVLGSLLIPLRLIGTVLLNVSITIAMTMLVFQFVRGVAVLWLMPLILFVVALGLGMDYDIFLTTRIREEVSKGHTDDKAIMTAVEKTGGIITACGLVMGGAFGSMLLSSTSLLQEFGFGLAFAIFLDAMLLRIYLVPAIMLLLQKWNWYAPGRLQRVRRREKPRNH